MLESLRRLLNKGPKAADLSPLQKWAESHGCQLKRVRDAEGCLMDADTAEDFSRLEAFMTRREARV